MALYTNFEAVRDRLRGKVRFSEDGDNENRMSIKLANALINEAEGQLEFDLSPRYMAPFQTDAGGAFNLLPSRPTGQILKTLAELKAVMRILDTDFGRGTATDGDNYYKSLERLYKSMVDQLLEKKKDKGQESSGFKYPPLPGLRLNYMNTEADDGYAGRVIVASGSPSQGYPKGQINDPSETFWNGWPAGWNPHSGSCE